MQVITGFDLAVGEFVAKGVGLTIDDMYPFTAIGVAINDELVAGIIYNNYRKHDIQLTAYSKNTRWLTKNILHEIFKYPYTQLGCVRTTAVTGRANKRTRKLLEGVGYRLEGVHPRGLDGKQIAVSYGMLRENCKWLNLKECTNEQKSSERTRPSSNSTGPRPS